MARRRLELDCPACATPVRTRLAVSGSPTRDGATGTDVLFGKPIRCEDCDYEFEVLFYPTDA